MTEPAARVPHKSVNPIVPKMGGDQCQAQLPEIPRSFVHRKAVGKAPSLQLSGRSQSAEP